MGWRQKLTPSVSRTALALVLTLVAVAVPCSFWYFAGWRAVQQDAVRWGVDQERVARATAQQLAERLRTRFELLRKVEEKRPFYHYQNLIHDPNGAYEGASVHPSPLAEGPSDPYVLAYFQISPAGQLSLPTLNDEVPQPDKTPEEIDRQRRIRKQLGSAVAACVGAFQPAGGNSDNTQKSVNTQLQAANIGLPQMADNLRVVKMKSEAWAQNQSANAFFLNNSVRSNNAQIIPQIRDAKSTSVFIHIGPFQWHTIPVDGQPALSALREVITPEGKQIQGFAIASSSAADVLQGSSFTAELLPPGAVGKDLLTAPVGDTGWHVSVDTTRTIADAEVRASEARSAFLHLFYNGMAAAVAAGCCVVVIVWQSERLARQRSQFAAAAAHELRTPLAGLRMYSDMLAEGLGNPTRSKEYARRVADEAERLGRVISNVLGFTRLERGMLNIHASPGDLGAVVREAVIRQQPCLTGFGMQVEFASDDDLPVVSFDPDAVSTILQNLLDNAEKHTRSAEDRRIHVSLRRSNQTVDLVVADHGPGIPVRFHRRIFRAFARINDADAPAGLGLGLSLAHALVRAHGGRLTCCETTGGGATFTAAFPA